MEGVSQKFASLLDLAYSLIPDHVAGAMLYCRHANECLVKFQYEMIHNEPPNPPHNQKSKFFAHKGEKIKIEADNLFIKFLNNCKKLLNQSITLSITYFGLPLT